MTIRPLRELAVTVREHGSGSFYWILIERSAAGDWKEMAVSEHYQTSWPDAFDAGVVQLHKQVPDEQQRARQRKQRVDLTNDRHGSEEDPGHG